MSAGSTNGIGPVSVRYAAQIRELLYTQAVQRAAAEQEAARQADAAEKAARFQPEVDHTPVAKVDVEAKSPPNKNDAAASSEHDAPKPAPAKLINLHA